MSIRTIMIFPEFENMEIIDNIRKKYDPLAELVRPHITLVFPFESSMSNAELAGILNVRLRDIKPFEIKLCGISKQEDDYGKSLFLNVLKGIDEVKAIHRVLYDNEFDKGLDYVPHMTVGKFPTLEMMERAFDNIKLMEDIFCTVVKKVSVEMIGCDEESIIIMEKELEG